MAPELPTQPFRDEHAALVRHIEDLREAGSEIPRLSVDERRERVAAALGFLRGTLIPHAEAEERVLYPEWARLVGYEEAAAPMVDDHRQIVARVERLEETPAEDVDALQELLYGLYALITVHFRKEEVIQLPAFDAQPDEVVESMLERMGHDGGHSHG